MQRLQGHCCRDAVRSELGDAIEMSAALRRMTAWLRGQLSSWCWQSVCVAGNTAVRQGVVDMSYRATVFRSPEQLLGWRRMLHQIQHSRSSGSLVDSGREEWCRPRDDEHPGRGVRTVTGQTGAFDPSSRYFAKWDPEDLDKIILNVPASPPPTCTRCLRSSECRFDAIPVSNASLAAPASAYGHEAVPLR